jgi:hypothetical protein
MIGTDGREWILAKNRNTGGIYEIRPDMLEIDGHPWILVDETGIPVDTSPKVAKPKPKEDVPDVILTKDGKPFKTEHAARSALVAKKLSQADFAIIEAEDGFIITKV